MKYSFFVFRDVAVHAMFATYCSCKLNGTAVEKFHLHNNGGNAFMQLTTLNLSNNVGLVFGDSATINKGSLIYFYQS